MPDILARFLSYLIPVTIAFVLAAISSKFWVRIRPLGAVGIYFISMAVVANYEGSATGPLAFVYGVTTLAGLVMLVGDVGGRFGKRDASG